MTAARALILVDIQNDFVPGGALAVPDGDAVIAVANSLMASYGLVVASQDWHPADHRSFASQHPGQNVGAVIDLDGLDQILWPDHCVQGSPGAEFCAALEHRRIHEVIRKGTARDIDSYSAFFDNGHRQSTGLTDLLRGRAITAVDIMGLATDYCVKFTALDGVAEGFDTTVIVAGCRAVNLQPGDADRALGELRSRGVHVQ